MGFFIAKIMSDKLQLDFIHKALLDGFNTQSLRRLLKFRLDKDLDHITQGKNLNEVVYEVIDAAKTEGWLQELIVQAREENPGNYFISMLGDEGSMQGHDSDSASEVREIRIFLFGSTRLGTPGYIDIMNDKWQEIDSRTQRIEIMVEDRSTASKSLFESVLFQGALLVLGLAAIASLLISAVPEVIKWVS